jgi:hypothetical protein
VESILSKLRATDVKRRIGPLKKEADHALISEFERSGVKFVVSTKSEAVLEHVYYDAIYKLLDCIKLNQQGAAVLQEGGVYDGCWLESTGTINAELLSRFIPSVAQSTFEQFADGQREDGLIPYKVSAGGPIFRQIQLVTPLARSVWNHYKLNGSKDDLFLRKMYLAMIDFDHWLDTYRNTRGTGCVEAFCTFDTGHDLSARFWHIPDTPHLNDPKQYDPNSPVLPYLAPDLTANVYVSRKYYALMAHKLSVKDNEKQSSYWSERAERSLQSLMTLCYDPQDRFFYDVDRHGKFVKVQSDVLLRVLACEVGDDELFANALQQYLLNTRKFFAKYPFTSIAMDDPRFDPHSTYNSWSGATNFLSIIRTAHAFEYHHRYVELTWMIQPIVSAISRMTRFGQTLSPWTGQEGYTESYSPAILCTLDFIERLCGILPTPYGELWFTGLLPYPMDHGQELANQAAYSRTVDGQAFELVNTEQYAEIYIGGQSDDAICRFPSGLRVITDRKGALLAVVGMSVRTVEGKLVYRGVDYSIRVAGNEVLAFDGAAFHSVSNPGVIMPSYE